MFTTAFNGKMPGGCKLMSLTVCGGLSSNISSFCHFLEIPLISNGTKVSYLVSEEDYVGEWGARIRRNEGNVSAIYK